MYYRIGGVGISLALVALSLVYFNSGIVKGSLSSKGQLCPRNPLTIEKCEEAVQNNNEFPLPVQQLQQQQQQYPYENSAGVRIKRAARKLPPRDSRGRFMKTSPKTTAKTTPKPQPKTQAPAKNTPHHNTQKLTPHHAAKKTQRHTFLKHPRRAAAIKPPMKHTAKHSSHHAPNNAPKHTSKIGVKHHAPKPLSIKKVTTAKKPSRLIRNLLPKVRESLIEKISPTLDSTVAKDKRGPKGAVTPETNKPEAGLGPVKDEGPKETPRAKGHGNLNPKSSNATNLKPRNSKGQFVKTESPKLVPEAEENPEPEKASTPRPRNAKGQYTKKASPKTSPTANPNETIEKKAEKPPNESPAENPAKGSAPPSKNAKTQGENEETSPTTSPETAFEETPKTGPEKTPNQRPVKVGSTLTTRENSTRSQAEKAAKKATPKPRPKSPRSNNSKKPGGIQENFNQPFAGSDGDSLESTEIQDSWGEKIKVKHRTTVINDPESDHHGLTRVEKLEYQPNPRIMSGKTAVTKKIKRDNTGTLRDGGVNGNGTFIAGHIIPAVLGGPNNQKWNVFPQDAGFNNSGWKKVENILRDNLDQNRTVSFAFVYPNDRTNVPSGFRFEVNPPIKGHEDINGYYSNTKGQGPAANQTAPGA